MSMGMNVSLVIVWKISVRGLGRSKNVRVMEIVFLVYIVIFLPLYQKENA